MSSSSSCIPTSTYFSTAAHPAFSGSFSAQDWQDRSSTQQRDWEQDSDRLRHLQQRAGNTVTDLSESTLDSIISGAESLKTKLAQLRTERELLEAEKKAAQSA